MTTLLQRLLRSFASTLGGQFATESPGQLLRIIQGYEVNVSFAPVIYYDGWLDDWRKLFHEMNEVFRDQVKQQLATEIIFLTHNESLHHVNMLWHPKAEDVLCRPDIQ